jgi:hypothetical protein
MIRPIAPERLAATQAKLRASILQRTPDPQNRAYALALRGISVLRFRNRVFHVPPVSYPVGLELQGLHLKLKKIGEGSEDPESLRALLAVLEEAAAVCWSLCKPVALVDRLFWRWLTNPFLDATYQELGELLGFFFACRTRSTVRLQAGSAVTLYERSISPTTLRSSWRGMAERRGPTGSIRRRG